MGSVENFPHFIEDRRVIYAALLLYNVNKLFCMLLIAINLKSVWGLDVQKSSVDKLTHSDSE